MNKKICIAIIFLGLLFVSGCSEDCIKTYEFDNNGKTIICHKADYWGNIRELSNCEDGNNYANPINVIITCEEKQLIGGLKNV